MQEDNMNKWLSAGNTKQGELKWLKWILNFVEAPGRDEKIKQVRAMIDSWGLSICTFNSYQ